MTTPDSSQIITAKAWERAGKLQKSTAQPPDYERIYNALSTFLMDMHLHNDTPAQYCRRKGWKR